LSGNDNESKLFGLVGRKLGHSLSMAMFADILPQVKPGGGYFPFEAEPADLGRLVDSLRALNAGGVNVTVPYKESIVAHLDGVEGDADALGAVNCVVSREGRLVGHNTDVGAFAAALGQLDPCLDSCLILGAGGAAKAVVLALRRMGAGRIQVAARRSSSVEESSFLDRHAEYVPWSRKQISTVAADSTVVINATPLGMTPDIESTPMEDGFHSGQVVSDLVYSPRPTRFLRIAAGAGARTQDGLEMLARQAAESLRLWTGAQVAWEKFFGIAEKAL